jgi:hypothetical protein
MGKLPCPSGGREWRNAVEVGSVAVVELRAQLMGCLTCPDSMRPDLSLGLLERVLSTVQVVEGVSVTVDPVAQAGGLGGDIGIEAPLGVGLLGGLRVRLFGGGAAVPASVGVLGGVSCFLVAGAGLVEVADGSPGVGAVVDAGTYGQVRSSLAGLLHDGSHVLDGSLEVGCPDTGDLVGGEAILGGGERHDPGLLMVRKDRQVVALGVVGVGQAGVDRPYGPFFRGPVDS